MGSFAVQTSGRNTMQRRVLEAESDCCAIQGLMGTRSPLVCLLSAIAHEVSG